MVSLVPSALACTSEHVFPNLTIETNSSLYQDKSDPPWTLLLKFPIPTLAPILGKLNVQILYSTRVRVRGRLRM